MTDRLRFIDFIPAEPTDIRSWFVNFRPKRLATIVKDIDHDVELVTRWVTLEDLELERLFQKMKTRFEPLFVSMVDGLYNFVEKVVRLFLINLSEALKNNFPNSRWLHKILDVIGAILSVTNRLLAALVHATASVLARVVTYLTILLIKLLYKLGRIIDRFFETVWNMIVLGGPFFREDSIHNKLRLLPFLESSLKADTLVNKFRQVWQSVKEFLKNFYSRLSDVIQRVDKTKAAYASILVILCVFALYFVIMSTYKEKA